MSGSLLGTRDRHPHHSFKLRIVIAIEENPRYNILYDRTCGVQCQEFISVCIANISFNLINLAVKRMNIINMNRSFQTLLI